ncbi:hypothetical protein PSACC_03626 [Paramicrosporidium saccamoebae]|uniref:Xanthine dehydrogenase n=1 Tax=Paramicrosporidium saccamoebae TaxID=1246581 RepID=A0A2H9TFN5_9FUNG|nr:hypothetical protein PSACC_03626 [Paramicrosporidium saccamoebae]
MSEFVTWINGKEYRRDTIDTEQTLLQFLRQQGLTGSKLGCGEGGCGACTIILYTPNKCATRNACILPLAAVHEKAVLTVEGLGNTTRPHMIQREMAGDASQCGFCTPGFVMSVYAAWRNGITEVEEVLDGNLCRCTGYRPIIDAVQRVCAMGDQCCRVRKQDPPTVPIEPTEMTADSSIESTASRSPDQEIIYPPGLAMRLRMSQKMVTFGGRVKWIRPVTLEELIEQKEINPGAKIVFGNTEVGVETKLKGQFYPIMIYAGDIPQLNYIQALADGVQFGAGVCLTDMKEHCKNSPDQGLQALYEMLRWFAGTQIRNAASWAGNVATASPISDLNPVWCVLDAKLTVASKEGNRSVDMSSFFLGYRKTALQTAEVITAIQIRNRRKGEFVMAYKQSKRRDDDIAIVNAAFCVELDDDNRVTQCSMAFGGMGPMTIMSKTASAALIGQIWTAEGVAEETTTNLQAELALAADAVGGMTDYRNALVSSFFFKFYLHVASEIGMQLAEEQVSAIAPRKALPYTSTQIHPTPEGKQCTGQAIPHLSALKHSTGTAQYVDDLPQVHGELHAGLLLSSRSHAKIRRLETSPAYEVPGVVEVVTWRDVRGTNQIGPVFKDERVFVEDEVTSCGQIVALVLAEDQRTAQRAARLIEEAIEAGSFYSPSRKLEKGDAQAAIASSPIVVNGNCYIGGQEHFYLETQAALVIPKPEDAEYEIIASTQSPTEAQLFASHVLDIPAHKVTCRVKRLGGGFGGKETRSNFLVAALAVAAQRCGRPVRCMLDRDEDMIFSGQRHPFKMHYRAGMDAEGVLQGVEIELFSNGGHSLDLSLGVLERAMTTINNSYHFPASVVHGRVCKTNLPSNTAFRGFGCPQGNFFCETIIEHLAQVSRIDPHVIRRKNLYVDGNVTPFGMEMEDTPLVRMWEELVVSSEYMARLQKVKEFNAVNRWKKRGIAIIPTTFGVAFGVRFLNQAGALVHIYRDGSILLTHGGVEMGQGLHTKMTQIAADVFGVALDQVHFNETSTATVPNTSPSAASVSSDLNGMAVLRACTILMERLQPLIDAHPSASFQETVGRAYNERIDLSARGFYATPDLGFDWTTGTGRLYNYFTYGVGVSEVEIDVLTGDHTVLRTDILMDLGRSLNPTVDIGQIEGAFTQGLGLFTMEQPLYLSTGMLLNRGPGGYKIPTAGDIPRQFHVALLKDRENHRAVHSSKAVGEPPLFLAASVLFAIQHAVRSARRDAIHDCPPLVMDSPATAERIRLACGDAFVAVENPRLNKQAWCFEV